MARLTRREYAGVVLAAVVVTAVVLYGLVAWVYLPRRAALSDSVRDLADSLEGFERKAAQAELIQAELAAVRAELAKTDEILIPAGPLGPAKARLSRTIRDMWPGKDKLPDVNDHAVRGDDRRIGIRLRMQCTTEELVDYLQRIEQHTPVLSFDSMTVSAVRKRKKDDEEREPVTLNVNITLYGVMAEEDR